MKDRLTFEGNFCDIAQCQEPYPCKYSDTGCTQKQVWERLKEYEDTGIMPEEAIAIKNALMGKPIAEVKEFDGVPLDRLRELARADKDGLCVILPCKVGDIVYIINRDGENSIGKYEVTTSEIDIHKYKITDIVKRDYEFWADEVGGGYIVTFSKESFGKTVFLTREEAEEALKGDMRNAAY